ncbi:hypothetical protein scyTo_0001921 [Scyliorhinus torazame]|uniref:Uncharacterized protein n=1 Tax=Scyliorhinus torazame TaxID=75743 RepID=A0A401PGN9_SCYTO|nr:hypothetical protein [Scyliorhinus torazame]
MSCNGSHTKKLFNLLGWITIGTLTGHNRQGLQPRTSDQKGPQRRIRCSLLCVTNGDDDNETFQLYVAECLEIF